MATKKSAAPKATRKSPPTPAVEVLDVKPVVKPAAAAPAATAPAPTAAPKATFEQIKARAYEVWLRKGCPSGQDVQNWEQAERELGVK